MLHTLTWTVGFITLIFTGCPAVTLPGEGYAMDGATATGKLSRVAPEFYRTKGQETIEEVAVGAETWSSKSLPPISPGRMSQRPDSCP
jgi:hypothetical protein